MTWTRTDLLVLSPEEQRVFVNSMSDLFHEDVTNEQIAAVFGVMAACPQHTFQVLTKRPQRMLEWFEWMGASGRLQRPSAHEYARQIIGSAMNIKLAKAEREWPLPNVWLGVSAEDQQRANERIPLLLQCPAAVRFVSAEPLLGPIDFTHMDVERDGLDGMYQINALTGRNSDMGRPCADVAKLDWIIVGGESGPGARGFNVEWARSIVEQCRSAGAAVFVKQLGATPFHGDDGAGWAVSSVHGKHWRWDDSSTTPMTAREQAMSERNSEREEQADRDIDLLSVQGSRLHARRVETYVRDLRRDIADRDATIAALTERAEGAERERDRLRKLFDDADQREHNVLALVDHYQSELLEAREAANLDAVHIAELEHRAREACEAYDHDPSVARLDAAIAALAELLSASSAKPAPKLAWERDEDGEVWIANHNGLLLRVDGVPGQHVLWEVVGRAHVPSGTIPAPSDGGPIDRAKVDAAKVAAERAAGVQHEGSERG